MAWFQCSVIQILVLCGLNPHPSRGETGASLNMHAPGDSGDAVHIVTVNLTLSQHACDVRFLSVAIGSRRVTSDWNGSEKLRNLASALSPADVRLGGTSANFLRFDPSVGSGDPDRFYTARHKRPFTVTGRQWDLFVEFLTKVGWDLLFNFNNFLWTKDGLWDKSNAELFLNYSSAKGVRISYFQLGNEPHSYKKFNIVKPAQDLVRDYMTLNKLISQYPLYAASKLCGPDVSDVGTRWNARDYLQGFVAAGASDVIDEISIHQYYKAAHRTRLGDFLSVSMLNSLKYVLGTALNISTASPRPLPISLTETSSCSGGGAAGLSDRYVAGFLWLDKLGVAAQSGVTRVFRQSFVGGSYGLISYDNFPHPDFYLSVLYKRLIEGPVFNLDISPANPQLRVYAHCARAGTYPPGALVVYYLNLDTSKTVLALEQFQGYDLHLYLLTPGDTSGLTSRHVKLNGHVLLMPGTELPALSPRLHTGHVAIEALSFGFIVVPQANVSLCVDHFSGGLVNVDVGPQ